jgi:hypothetical protein
MVILKEFLEAGKLTPVIDRTYPLSEIREAMRYMHRGTCLRKNRHHPVGASAAEWATWSRSKIVSEQMWLIGENDILNRIREDNHGRLRNGKPDPRSS